MFRHQLMLFCALFTAMQTCYSQTTTLKKAAEGKFLLGVGVSDAIPQRSEDWPLLTSQFSAVTPENCMKPAAIANQPGFYKFEQPDAFVEWAVEKKMTVVGHCLVWAKDDRTPAWFYKDGDKDVTKEVLLARMKKYIDDVAGRYRGKIAMWDVVNEALGDGNDEMRDSGWLRICGEEFIGKAFEYAHQADPNALLIYNDYNNELPAKREKMIRLLQRLLDQKVPVQAVGLQGHYEIDKIPYDDIDKTLTELKKLGLPVVISEIDIDVVQRGKWWAEDGKYREELKQFDPYRDGCPPEVLARQAEQYGKLFAIFNKHSDSIQRVTFWNLHDGQSWLNYFPWDRVNHPLLFDRKGIAKPAFDSVIEELRKKP